MLRALWFFFKLALAIGLIVWIATQQGAVDIQWRGYDMAVDLGVFLLVLAGFVVVAVAIVRVGLWLLTMPARFSKSRAQRSKEKGYRSLTRGLVAVAAGDARKATQHAKVARRLLPEDGGLPVLLEAQAARLRGDDTAARMAFEELLKDKDAAFFGIRGLLKGAIDSGNKVAALDFARTALEQNPKQPWILQSVYDLELQNGHWHAALETLGRMRKHKVITPSEADSDEVALLLALADEDKLAGHDKEARRKVERAVKIDPLFVPAVTRLGEIYIGLSKNRKTAAIIQRVWKLNPHPDLALLWDKLAPANKGTDTLRRLRWHEKLIAANPEAADGHLAAAMVAMEDGLWGEARAHLQKAEEAAPTAQVYRLLAKLEDLSASNARAEKIWLERAAAAQPDPVWYCTQTGTVYEDWSPVALPHRAFNTIRWGQAAGRYSAGDSGAALNPWDDPLMIEQRG